MGIQFNKLKVTNVKQETIDTVSISFLIPNYLKDEFNYKAGQYLTISVDINGRKERRAYSISTSPFENKPITVTIKKSKNGLVSNYLTTQVKVGDFLDVMKPLGHFTIDFDEKLSRNFVLFAGGSGITPLISILKSVLLKETNSKVYLIYANRTFDTTIFKEELENLKNYYSDKLFIINIYTKENNWSGLNEKLNNNNVKELVKEILNNNFDNAEFFICGPYNMMQNVQLGLNDLLIESSKIHKESFTAPIDDETNKKESKEIELIKRLVKIRIYGEIHDVEVNPDETITQAAMDKGLDPPFSCQIGACSTCRAKVIKGAVIMDESEGLTQEEIDNGYILACQAHPLTDDTYIDMDDN